MPQTGVSGASFFTAPVGRLSATSPVATEAEGGASTASRAPVLSRADEEVLVDSRAAHMGEPHVDATPTTLRFATSPRSVNFRLDVEERANSKGTWSARGSQYRETPFTTPEDLLSASCTSNHGSRVTHKGTGATSFSEGVPFDSHVFSSTSIMEGVQRRMQQLGRIDSHILLDISEQNNAFGDVTHITSKSTWVDRPPPEQPVPPTAVSLVAAAAVVASVISVGFIICALCVLEAVVDRAGLSPDDAAELTAYARRTGIMAFVPVAVGAVLLGSLVATRHGRVLRRIAVNLEQMQLYEEREDGAEAAMAKGQIPMSRVADVQRLQSALDRLLARIATFNQFLPETVVRSIVRGEDKAQRLHVERRDVTIMFSDIKDFTNIAESLRPKDLLLLLTRYLDVMSRIAHTLDGVVAEILGDGLLVFWNTPDEVQDHCPKAAAAALAQLRALRPLNTELKALQLPTLSVRIGLHTGKVLTGNIGSLSRMKFGCMGDPVNLCARLEGLCKLYSVPVVCSGAMYAAIKQHGFFCRKLDVVRVKGKSKPTELYEIIGLEARPVDPARNPNIDGALCPGDICAVATQAYEMSSKCMRKALEHSAPASVLRTLKHRIRLSIGRSNESGDNPLHEMHDDWTAAAARSGSYRNNPGSAADTNGRTKRSAFSESASRLFLQDTITLEMRQKKELYERALTEYQATNFLVARDLLQELLGLCNEMACGSSPGGCSQDYQDFLSPRSFDEADAVAAAPVSAMRAAGMLDGPAQRLLDRINLYIADDGVSVIGLSAEQSKHWDGITDLMEK